MPQSENQISPHVGSQEDPRVPLIDFLWSFEDQVELDRLNDLKQAQNERVERRCEKIPPIIMASVGLWIAGLTALQWVQIFFLWAPLRYFYRYW